MFNTKKTLELKFTHRPVYLIFTLNINKVTYRYAAHKKRPVRAVCIQMTTDDNWPHLLRRHVFPPINQERNEVKYYHADTARSPSASIPAANK